MKNVELEKPDSDDDEWKFKVMPGESVVKRMTRDDLDDPGEKYRYKLKTKFKFIL